MTAPGRDQQSVRTLLDTLKKTVPFNSGLVLTVVPRGGLQVAQPANVSEALLKSYGKGFYNEDRLAWQTILKRKPQRPSDVYKRDEFDKSAYGTDLLQPEGLKHVVALPVNSPVLQGYPGVVILFRSADEADFNGKQIDAAMGVINQLDTKRQGARDASSKKNAVAPLRHAGDAPAVSFVIVDSKLKAVYNGQGFNALDSQLRTALLDHAKRRMHAVNSHGSAPERVQLPDAHGDVWVFNVIGFKRFPALGDGPFAFLCRQPSSSDWLSLKAQDFQADQELSRLIPSLKYMQEEFHRGPTLPEIAKQVHLSPFHFHRRFTELMGLTPKQFLLECQIQEAKSDLIGQEKELAQIAKDCGFAHQSHFTSRFKQTTGLTPTRWRRMVSERQSEN